MGDPGAGHWVLDRDGQSRLAVPLPVRGVAPAAWGGGQWHWQCAVPVRGGVW